MAMGRVPDFSFAGWHMGEEPPHVPTVIDARTFGVRADGVADDTASLRAALEATASGALELPAGRIVLRDRLRIERSHIVVRGQGQRETVLVMDRSLPNIHPEGDPLHGRLYGFIEARGVEGETKLADVVGSSRRGGRRLVLDRPVALSPGQLVRLRLGRSDALLRRLLGGHLEPGPQTPIDYEHYVDWVTPVQSIDGTSLTLGRALRVDVEPAWGAEVLAFEPTLEDIGIEDLSFEFPGTPRDPSQYDAGLEGFNAIYLRRVTNAWVRNVTIVDADNGITLEGCRFGQVDNVRFLAARRSRPSGHHALWAKDSQDCLFARFRIETQLADELTVEAFANGNVFMAGVAEALGLDHHRNAPYENLFTDIDAGSGERLWKSGGDAGRGPHAGAGETLWNVRFRGPPPPLPGALHFDKPIDAGWPQLNLIGVSGYAPTSPAEEVWIDPAPDAPPNLYLAQRRARLERTKRPAGSPSLRSDVEQDGGFHGPLRRRYMPQPTEPLAVATWEYCPSTK